MFSDFSPFGNTSSATPTWHSEPKQRGAFSILSSCVITLGLCVRSAVHINVCPDGGQFRIKLLWVVLAMLAPEMVVFTEWQQRREAQLIDLAAREAFQQPVSSYFQKLKKVFRFNKQQEEIEMNALINSEAPLRHLWTPVHSFYAIMGGFAMDISGSRDPKDAIFPDGCQRLTITPTGILFLLKEHKDMLPNISKAEIQDKSKGDAVAKILVCLQAFWFCVQCLARLIGHLPISLLELNTVGHALCALAIYYLWWNKPLDVKEPTSIQSSEALELAALMCMYSNGELEGNETHNTIETKFEAKDQWFRYHNAATSLSNSDERRQWAEKAIQRYKLANEHHGWIRLKVPVLIKDSLALRNNNWPRIKREKRLKGTPNLDDSMALYRDESVQIFVAVCFTIAGAIYGGLHLLAWNAPFPSKLQQTLWRISAITIASFGPVLIMGHLVFNHRRMFQKLLPDKTKDNTEEKYSIAYSFFARAVAVLLKWVGVILMMVLGIAIPALAGLYVLARIFLVVESFVTLRYLFEAAYRVPSWTQYFIHLE